MNKTMTTVLIIGMMVLLIFGIVSTKEDEITLFFKKISKKSKTEESVHSSADPIETAF